MAKFLIGLMVGKGIAYLAYRAGALNRNGGFAAGLLGTVVFGLGGVGWAVVLLTFFISASGLSRVFILHKTTIGKDFAKGSRRDAGQVIANGGVGGVLVLMTFFVERFLPESNLLAVLWIAFAASFAGANADTWATELGVLSRQEPFLLSTFKHVPKGTSGGVSLAGTAAALAGSALVGTAAVLCAQAGWAPISTMPLWGQFLLITVAGLIGSIVDSLLGATIQVIYFCPACQKETERHPLHGCGATTSRIRGLPWLNNDWVNGACTLSAVGISLIFLWMM